MKDLKKYQVKVVDVIIYDSDGSVFGETKAQVFTDENNKKFINFVDLYGNFIRRIYLDEEE